MSWSISTHNIPAISNLNQVEAVYNNASVWPNSHSSWKPLATRRQKHKRIVRLYNGLGYELVLHNTPLVTYMSDGIIRLQSYNSTSSVMFANAVAPTGMHAVSHQRDMYWSVLTDDGLRYFIPSNGLLVFEPTAAGNWKLISSCKRLTEQRFDRSAAAYMRKKVKPYTDWYALVSKLGALPEGRNWFLGSQRAAELLLRGEPPTIDEYPHIASLHHSLGSLKQSLYELSGAYYMAEVEPGKLPRKKS